MDTAFSETMEGLKDLQPQDSVFILNGRQNVLLDAVVETVSADVITVFNVSKQRVDRFSRLTGETIAPDHVRFNNPERKPILITRDDWRAHVLLARRRFGQMREYLNDAIKRYAEEPSEYHADRLTQATKSFIALGAALDPIALRAGSIQEYVNLRNRAQSPEEGQQ